MGFKPYRATEYIHNIEGGSSHFNEGPYLWEFVSVKPTPEDVSGDTGFYFRLIARDGDPSCVGGTLSHFATCNDEGKGQFNLGIICNAGGIAPEALEKIIANVDAYRKHVAVAAALDAKLKGKRFAAHAADSSYREGRSELVLNTVLPPDQFQPAAAPAAATTGRGGRKKADPAAPPVEEPDADSAPDEGGDVESDFEAMLAAAMQG